MGYGGEAKGVYVSGFVHRGQSRHPDVSGCLAQKDILYHTAPAAVKSIDYRKKRLQD